MEAWPATRSPLSYAIRSFRALLEPVTLPQLKERWLEASSAALELIARLPLNEVGCLYLDRTGKPVCPDPAGPDFPKLTRHFGSLKGAWPRIIED